MRVLFIANQPGERGRGGGGVDKEKKQTKAAELRYCLAAGLFSAIIRFDLLITSYNC